MHTSQPAESYRYYNMNVKYLEHYLPSDYLKANLPTCSHKIGKVAIQD